MQHGKELYGTETNLRLSSSLFASSSIQISPFDSIFNLSIQHRMFNSSQSDYTIALVSTTLTKSDFVPLYYILEWK